MGMAEAWRAKAGRTFRLLVKGQGSDFHSGKTLPKPAEVLGHEICHGGTGSGGRGWGTRGEGREKGTSGVSFLSMFHFINIG